MRHLSEHQASDIFEWYLNLENRFLQITDIIPLNSKLNLTRAKSPRLVPIILESASIIDSIFQILFPMRKVRRNKKGKKIEPNIADFCRELEPILKLSQTSSLVLSSPPFVMTPFDNWSESNAPTWWHAYNNIKHNRIEHSQKASMVNTLNAMCGLQQLMVKCTGIRRLMIRFGWIDTAGYNPSILQELISQDSVPEPRLLSYTQLFVTPLVPILWQDEKNIIPIHFANSHRLCLFLGRND